MGLLKQEVKARPDPWMNSVHFRARGLMNPSGQSSSVPVVCIFAFTPLCACVEGGWYGREGGCEGPG